MSDRPEVRDRPLDEQVVLLGLAELAAAGETPARSYEVKETVQVHLERVTVGVGELTDREATRSLNRLAADGVAAEAPPESESAVGKGRPKYDLDGDPEAVLDELADVDAVTELAERIRRNR